MSVDNIGPVSNSVASLLDSKQVLNGKYTLYKTFFKKGHQMQEMYFQWTPDLDSAVAAVKSWLFKRHLKHIHTVRFLTDLNEAPDYQDAEGIDVTVS